MQPPPIPTRPKPKSNDLAKALVATLAAFVIFGVIGNGVSDDKVSTKVAAPPQTTAAENDKPSSLCDSITRWKGNKLSANPSPAEARAWKAELDAKLNNPVWVKCMTDKYGSLLN